MPADDGSFLRGVPAGALIVVMGVSGSGKTTVGRMLAQALAVPFCEGDDLHPAANVAKMAAGSPLDDQDRAPWLARVNAWMCDHAGGGVVSCSALRRAYRDRLRAGLAGEPAFVLLEPPLALLRQRLAERRGHFMPATLLDDQLATLERPAADERALILASDIAPDLLVLAIRRWLDREPGPREAR